MNTLNNSLFILLIPIISSVGYHLGQKILPKKFSPIEILALVYGLCFLSTVLIATNSQKHFFQNVLQLNKNEFLSIIFLSIAILGIEWGYLLAYRVGLPLSSTSLICYGVQTIVLAGLGFLIFKETVQWQSVLSIIFILIGLQLSLFKS